MTARQNLNTAVTGTLDNSGGTLSAQTVTANAASLKNANGTISADTVSVAAPPPVVRLFLLSFLRWRGRS
ncbi:hypothetical protein ACT2FY_06930 [Paraburkholderia fungorum]|uniref:hypothetical protein n=1 Tax=Paraburkholderia fungorum TaxID=134537 RepID=UPI00402B0997